MKNYLSQSRTKTVGLLMVGTFVEQFDFILYVHFAVILNESFFPTTNLHTQKLLSAFAFSIPYVLRPLGALLVGYIGDIKGNKYTIVITTFIMATSCLVIAFLPTYAQIGITAPIILIACRTLQSFAALGEIIGAQLYLTEVFTPPNQYLMVALVSCAADLGGICAIGAAHLTILYGFNWRIIFLLGALIAIVGTVLRSKLKETSSQLSKRKDQLLSTQILSNNNEKIPLESFVSQLKTSIAYCCMLFLWPVGFYFTYVYCSDLLKVSFSYTPHQIIIHNFIFSITSPCVMLVIALLTLKVHPFKIMQVRLVIFIICIILLPSILDHITTPQQLLVLQIFSLALWPSMRPGESIFFKYFNALKRFRYVSILFSTAKTIIHLTISFGMVLLIKHFNNWGLLVLIAPIVIGYTIGLYYFQNLNQRK